MSMRMLVCLLLMLPVAMLGCGKKSSLSEGEQAMADEVTAHQGVYSVTPGLGVTSVSLQGTDVDDAFIRRLSAFPELQRLSVRATKVTDESVPTILKMTKLKTLDVGDSKLTEKGKAALREAFADIALTGAEDEKANVFETPEP